MNTRGALTLVFDDGYQAVYDHVLPLLAAYKVQAVFAIPLTPEQGKIAGEHIATSDAWIGAAKKYGHELAGHSITHTDLTKLSASALKSELATPAKKLSASTLVYPGGAHTKEVVEAAKKTYTAARTVKYGIETLPPKDMMRLRTINFTKKNFSVARANIHALRALLQNRWLIETYHMVSENTSPLSHSVLLNDLDAHLDFITSLPIRIATIRDVTNKL